MFGLGIFKGGAGWRDRMSGLMPGVARSLAGRVDRHERALGELKAKLARSTRRTAALEARVEALLGSLPQGAGTSADADPFADVAALLTVTTPAAPEAADGAGAVPDAAAPTHVVLDALGGTLDDDDGRPVRAAYECLTRPLPLLGSGDAARIRAALDAEWPWAAELNELATEPLALNAALGKTWFWTSPVLLVGPAGVGKTRWARRLAELGGVPSRCISVAGNHDPYVVNGGSRLWRGSQASAPAQLIAQSGCANPLVVIDEIEKSGRSSHFGGVQDALLGVLERSSAMRHYDYHLMGGLDLRHVTWVLTANDVSELSEPLVSRCRVLHFPAPRPGDFDRVLAGVVADLARQHDVAPGALPGLPDASVEAIRREFGRDPCIRRVSGHVQAALGRAARGAVYDPAAGRPASGERLQIGFDLRPPR